MDKDIQALIDKQIEVIKKLQAVVLEEPDSAYTIQKAEALKEASIVLLNLAVVKGNLTYASSAMPAIDPNLFRKE